MNLFESILSPVVAGTRNWVRFGHVPKRPRRAGAKILITKHKYAVELPKEVPEYLRDLVDGTTKEAPHKMHLVTRLKENVIWQERRILHELDLLGPPGKMKILLNIPSVNKLLWQVKHAVSIKPLIIDGDNIPETEAEFLGGMLNENGVYTFFTEDKQLKELSPNYEKLTELPETPLSPNRIAKYDYKPFYYNYREDS